MKARRKRISRWLSGLPAVLVGSLWLILAEAWPGRLPESQARTRPSATRIYFRQTPPVEHGAELMPLVFVQPPPKAGDLLAEESPEAVRVLHGVGNNHLLDRQVPADRSVPDRVPELSGLTNPAAFRLAIPDGRLFRGGSAAERGITVEVSPTLRDRGFRLPTLDASTLGNTNTAWQVILVVDGTQDGRVENVFLESGTADPAFNRALVQKISLDATLTPGVPCRGRVVVSYGEE
jgi:hypothetical protein